jgi:cobalamin biosynthesis protein CobT
MKHTNSGKCEAKKGGRPSGHAPPVKLHDGVYEITPESDMVFVDYSKGERLNSTYPNYTPTPDFHVGGLANKVRRLLQIRSRQRTTYGQKKGKLDQRSLYRVGMRNEASRRVFKNKMETHSLKESVVHLVVDFSGSMAGDEIQHACDAAGQMSTVLTNLDIPHAVTGFTTSGRHTRLYLLKQYGEKPRDLGERMANASTELENNHDADAILYAEAQLARRSEKRKVMIVFSDGSPAGPKRGISQHLIDAVKCVEHRPDMDVYGIGIGTTCVNRYYSKTIVINDPAELENTLLDLIERVV